MMECKLQLKNKPQIFKQFYYTTMKTDTVIINVCAYLYTFLVNIRQGILVNNLL